MDMNGKLPCMQEPENIMAVRIVLEKESHLTFISRSLVNWNLILCLIVRFLILVLTFLFDVSSYKMNRQNNNQNNKINQ